MDIQRNLEANVEKRTKDTYGPPMGKRLLVFMDDMNMPKVGEAEGVGWGGIFCSFPVHSPGEAALGYKSS